MLRPSSNLLSLCKLQAKAVCRLLFAIVLIFGLLSSAVAASGFFPIDSSRMPIEVQRAARSVVRIEAPLIALDFSGSSSEANEARLKYRMLKAQLPALEAKHGFSAPHLAVLREELERCERFKKCMISTGGSGFFFAAQSTQSTQSTVMTAFHVVRSALEMALGPEFWAVSNDGTELMDISARRDAVLKLRFHLKLYDASGSVQFGDQPQDWVSVEALDDELLQDEAEWSEPAWAVDQVRLKLSRPVIGAQPLGLKPDRLGFTHQLDSSLKPGQVIFALGYPVASTDRGAFNSDGSSLRVVLGPLMSAFDLETFFSSSDEKQKLAVTPRGQKLLTTVFDLGQFAAGTDCYPQMSGGPAVTDQGDLIGVLIGAQPGGEDTWSQDGRLCIYSALK